MAKLYTQLASTLTALRHCESPSANESQKEWALRHKEHIEALVKEHMPSGSGFNNGTTLDLDKSTPERLVFDTAFHHMDEHGSYCGWTEHTVIVTPSLAFGFTMRVTGRDRRGIKEYIGDSFHTALSGEVAQS